MAKCDVVIQRWNCEERCVEDAVIHYDDLNRCAEHADPNVLAAYRCLKAISLTFGNGSKAEQCALAIEPKETSDSDGTPFEYSAICRGPEHHHDANAKDRACPDYVPIEPPGPLTSLTRTEQSDA